MNQQRRITWWSSLTLAIIVLGLAGLLIKSWAWGAPTVPVVGSAPALPLASATTMPSLAPMLDRVMPAVVSIEVEGRRQAQRGPQSPFGDRRTPLCQEGSPFYHSPLCQPPSEGSGQQPFRSLGSGVIIDAERGYVVTNQHVVAQGERFRIQLIDGRQVDATLVGQDAPADLALLQIKGVSGLVAIRLADSDTLRVGDYALAIGNPFGLGLTVTSGIVSALGRSGLDSQRYEHYIQTDAAINRGNSGGALINVEGALIGINTAIFAAGGGNIGIGFAIPSNMMKKLTDQMRDYGEVRRGVIGVVGTELTSDLAKAMGLNQQSGGFITEVVAGSAAARAGLQAGDVVISVNDRAVASFAAFRTQVSSVPIGTRLRISVWRQGEAYTTTVTVAAPTPAVAAAAPATPAGLAIAGLTVRQGQSSHGEQGVVVGSVAPGSLAQRMGLLVNDVVVAVNQQRTPTVAAFNALLAASPGAWVLQVRRGAQTVYLVKR